MSKNNLENKSSVLHFRRHGYSAGQYQNDKNLHTFYEQEQESAGQNTHVYHLKNILSLIQNISIEERYRDDPEQEELLKKKKDQAIKLIKDVLNKIGEYLAVIANIASIEASKDEYEPAAYRKKYQDTDQQRRIYHNALISNINIVNRFLVNNFGRTKEEIIEEWENREIEAGRPVLYANRIDFPENIICPDNMNLEDRDQVRKWAEQVGKYLSELKNGL
jgi:hypothetical protein